jgi:hypothetical protein
MRIETLFFGGGSFSTTHDIGDQEAYQRGYEDGARVDLHGARSSRLLHEH